MLATGTLLWPLALYAGLVVVLVGGMIGMSYVLGGRHRHPMAAVPYESGMRPTGSARVRFPANFYLIAMFFVIFDVEAVFIFAWAIAVRDLGGAGFVEIVIFIAVLMAALVYLWRVGALNWVYRPVRRRLAQSPRALPQQQDVAL